MRPESPTSKSVPRWIAILVTLAACCCPLLTDRQQHHALGATLGAEPGEDSQFIVIGSIELPGIPKVYRINTDGSNRVLLKSGGFDPALSPDGKQVAFITGGDKTAGVYLINTDGGNLRRVGLGGGLFPNWSPDGRQLLLTRMSDGFPELFAIDVDGIEHRRLVDEMAAMGTWSPDGQWLAYVVQQAGLFVAKADGTEPKRLAGGPNEITINPEWSRDSKQIFFTWMAGIKPMEVEQIWEREVAGLHEIDKLHLIDTSDLRGTQVTDAGLKELRKALPQLRVVHPLVP